MEDELLVQQAKSSTERITRVGWSTGRAESDGFMRLWSVTLFVNNPCYDYEKSPRSGYNVPYTNYLPNSKTAD
jgi:hypothetical protein